MKLAIYLLLVAAPVLAQDSVRTASPSGNATPISLAEAVRLARQNNPQAIQARGGVRASNAAARSAVGAFLPSLSVSAGTSRQYGRSTTFVLSDPSSAWRSSRGFSLNADLFNFSSFPNLRAARAEVDAAEANVTSQSYVVALDVAQQYYNALSAVESEQAARAQLAQAEQQLQASVRRVKAGAATKSDSLRSFVQVANAQVALITAQADLRGANAALTRLIGSSTVVTAMITDTSHVASTPLDSITLVSLALQGPALQEARASAIAARARQTSARSAYLPSISASYSRSGSSTGFGLAPGDNPNYGGQLSLSLNYHLFTQFSREEQIVRAKVARENADAVLRDAELAARQSAVQNLDALNTALQRVNAQRIAVAAAEEDLRVQQARYDNGLSTILDVLTSQTQLNQARANLIAARFDARIARAQIEALIGRELGSTITINQDTTR